MIWLASGGKTVGNFARGRRGESCSIVITFYIAILPSGSLNSFRRPDRYEARKIGIGGRGVSHLSRDPLWRGATTRTATEEVNGSHDSRECEYIYIFVPFSFAFSFSLPFLCVLRLLERKGIVESSPSPSLFLLFQNLFFLSFVFYFVHFQVVAKMLNIKLMFPRRNEDRAKVSSSRNWHISRSPLFGE